MSKRSSKSKRRSKTLPALGFAGVSFSLASGACASSSEATANTPSTSQSHEIFLSEEEISDVSLATFYVFDKENAGAPPLAQHQRLAFGGCRCGGGCGGCGGCRACGGGGGCAGIGGGGLRVVCAGIGGGGCAGWGGRCGVSCRCGGFFFRGCVGCVSCGGCGGCGGCAGSCWIWSPAWGWVYSCWSGSTPLGEASSDSTVQVAQTAEATESARTK
jgi:hypothetical protein